MLPPKTRKLVAMSAFSTNDNIHFEDSVLLDRIHHDICQERGFRSGSAMSTLVAKALIFLLSDGVSEEADLRGAMQIYLNYLSRKRFLN